MKNDKHLLHYIPLKKRRKILDRNVNWLSISFVAFSRIIVKESLIPFFLRLNLSFSFIKHSYYEWTATNVTIVLHLTFPSLLQKKELITAYPPLKLWVYSSEWSLICALWRRWLSIVSSVAFLLYTSRKLSFLFWSLFSIRVSSASGLFLWFLSDYNHGS